MDESGHAEPLDLDQFIEQCLLGYFTSSIFERCFLISDGNIVEETYEGTFLHSLFSFAFLLCCSPPTPSIKCSDQCPVSAES